MSSNHKVSFVIATRNENPDTVAATIQGLLATSYYGNWREIIVVDDCSDERFVYYHPEVIVMRNAEPMGSCLSRRRGCAAACGDVVVGLDAHMSFAPGWLEEMLKYVDSGALLCPPWMNYRQTQTYHWGCRFGWQGTRDHDNLKVAGLSYIGLFAPERMEPVVDIPMVIGACYVMRKDAYEAIGGWNPHYEIYGSEEQDISARAWLLGHGVKCVTGARVGHLDRDDTNRTPFDISWGYYEHNQAIMLKSLFEPETTRILEDYLEPMLPEVRESLARRDITEWRDFIQRRRKMSDAEFFQRFLKDESPIDFDTGRARLKTGEIPAGIVHRAVFAEEERLWSQRESFKAGSPVHASATLAQRNEPDRELSQLPAVPYHHDLAFAQWQSSVVVEAFGMLFGFQAEDANLLGPMLEGCGQDWEIVSASLVNVLYSVVSNDSKLHLYAGAELIGTVETASELTALVARSLRYQVVETAPAHLFVDAAVVEWRGHAVIILGDRWSGRSALLLELLRAGARYCSHAYAAIDLAGQVLPFAQPLEFIGAPGHPNREWAPDAFPCGGDALPIGLVVEAQLQPESSWKPRSISRANTIRKLFGQTLNAHRMGEKTFLALQHTVTGSLALEGYRDCPRETARALLRQLDQHLGIDETPKQRRNPKKRVHTKPKHPLSEFATATSGG